MIMAFQVGARLVLEPTFAVLPQIMARIKREGVTGFPCVPTTVAMLAEYALHREIEPQPIRYVTSTGSALSDNIFSSWRRYFRAPRSTPCMA